jgi:hypothetical protein
MGSGEKHTSRREHEKAMAATRKGKAVPAKPPEPRVEAPSKPGQAGARKRGDEKSRA